MKLCHVPAALGLIVSWVLLIIGFVKHREPAAWRALHKRSWTPAIAEPEARLSRE